MAGSHYDRVASEALEIAVVVSMADPADFPEAQALRTQTNQPEGDFVVTFTFNGVTVKVGKDTNLEFLYRDWQRALSGYLGENPVVGPDPKPELSEEELAKDAEVEAANKVRRDQESARYAAEAQAKLDRVTARMVDAPEMEFAGEEGKAFWQSLVDANKDGYGIGIIHYAERWARMMQQELGMGKTLAEAYRATHVEADLEGMSGASGGMAEQTLVQCWRHGAELALVREERRINPTSFWRTYTGELTSGDSQE